MEVLPGNDATWSGALLVAPPIGDPSIERQVMHVTDADTLDCGRYAAPTSDAALQRSSSLRAHVRGGGPAVCRDRSVQPAAMLAAARACSAGLTALSICCTMDKARRVSA